ncbi:RNA-binding domain-containing protein [Treponema zioleckii]|uniref:RNA-binding domain-containing protein n=1 Tax=Treponema zioleckii TaxID=331680 RepID=UPI00168A7461|nr:RNA-binding domain-containing protein [Treponema zioleckii]
MIDFENLESLRESKNLEFKEEISSSFLKTVSAFSNYGTGRILFGISDDKKIIGIENPNEVCLNLENKINDNIIPHPDFKFEISPQTNLIELTVFEGKNKPYTYRNKAYKRNDSSSIEVDRTEYNRLVLAGENKNFEELPSKNQELTFSSMQKKFSEILGVQEINKDIQKTLELYSDKEGYNIAASLVADKNDFSGIDIVRFGKNIDEILDRESFEKCSVFTQYDNSILLFRKYYQYEKIDGIERKLVELVPEKAFREAVANALIHRTWDSPANIRIEFYAEKIVITSPGGLSQEISKEEYLEGRLSILRNPILGMIFFRLHLIEKFGTGIRRIKNSYANSVSKPVFSVFDNSIQIELPVLSATPKLSLDEEKIYDALSGGMQLSSSELALKTGFSRDKVIRLASGLLEKRYIRTVGKGRGTKYTL